MTTPTGTVTFLFTDIEGSTKLWETQPDAMQIALERHDVLLRNAIETNGGTVFKTIGDAFCAAFATAPEALEAALLAQRNLNQIEAGVGSDLLKVRMALHTGAAERRNDDYFGQPLNRVARLLAAGHGGQVLLSQAACILVSDRLPKHATLNNMGEHRLKDLQSPEQVFQLLHPDLQTGFLPLKSLDYLPNNLPRQLTSFIGREKEMAEVKSLLEKTSLLTLTGSGGCGKTRLSLQVAADTLEQYADGVWLVELAPLGDPNLVPQTVADALKVREQQGVAIVKALLTALRDKQMLIILDNCEHVLDSAARFIDALLKSCPKVNALVSSREALGISGESSYRVPSLSLPELHKSYTPEGLSQYDAVRLFIDRAVSIKSDFSVTAENANAVASACSRLDGIPLAIELAAARVRSLSVENINSRLDQRFRLLTGGSRTALPRQQTLRAMIDWSYDLLNQQEKLLLLRLSTFAGGWTMEAAEQVCAGDGIEDWETLDLMTSLVDKSLVVYEAGGGKVRYRLLETVRQYARDRWVESAESSEVRARHRDYFLALAEKASKLDNGSEQAHWLNVLAEEHDNLRQALAHCLEESEGGVAGLRLAAALFWFWNIRGHVSEGRQHLAAVLSRPVGPEYGRARAEALNSAGILALVQSDYPAARALCVQSLAIWRELGDKGGIAGNLLNLAILLQIQCDYPAARTLHEQSLTIWRELGEKGGIAFSLEHLACLAWMQSDFPAAQALYNESLALRRKSGNNWGIANCLSGLGYVAWIQGDYAAARTLCEESLSIFRERGDKGGVARCLSDLGKVAWMQGDDAAARALCEESLTLRRELGDRWGIADSLAGLGNVERMQGDYTEARALYFESLNIRQELGDKGGVAFCFAGLGNVAKDQGDFAAARDLCEQSLAIWRELGNMAGVADCLGELGNLAYVRGDYIAARALCAESLGIHREIGTKGNIPNNFETIASVALKEGQAERSARLWAAAAALREAIGSPLPPNERERFEREVAVVLEALGEAVFSAAWEEGRAMTIENAIEYALTSVY